MKVALLNCAIITADGIYECYSLSLEEVKQYIKDREIISAIGHEATAQILTELLERNVPVNRIVFEQQPNQVAIVFKLNGRVPEGRILTKDEIEEIGYSFKILIRAPEYYELRHI